MYIDTHSRDGMEKSACQILCMSPLELQKQLTRIDEFAGDDDDYISKLDLFIGEKAAVYPDEVLLFHLARRLHGTEDALEGCNLADLLLSTNPLSSFLKERGIVFAQSGLHIETFFRGECVDWDSCPEGNSCYMKSRLGYFGRGDFCFNGFAFKDLLYKNSYARSLSLAPEFLGSLAECLQCEAIEREYMENSDYFCYEYKLPLTDVIFDGHDNFSVEEKQHRLLRCVLQRLYQYQTIEPERWYDFENLILRLADDYTLPAECCVGRERITSDMLS